LHLTYPRGGLNKKNIAAAVDAGSPDTPSASLILRKLRLTFMRIPIAMHTMWIFFECLVNLNVYFVLTGWEQDVQIAVAFASTFVFALIGFCVAQWSKDPIIAGVTALSLMSLAEQSMKKSQEEATLACMNELHKSLAMTQHSLSTMMKILTVILLMRSMKKREFF
jgi:hypothetical protein